MQYRLVRLELTNLMSYLGGCFAGIDARLLKLRYIMSPAWNVDDHQSRDVDAMQGWWVLSAFVDNNQVLVPAISGLCSV